VLDGRGSWDTTPVELAEKNPGPGIRFLRKNLQDLLQMLFSRQVESFESYLADVLREALRSHPELLRSREEVRLDYVLRFASLEEMLQDLVDRKVADLSYLGLNKLSDWVEQHMAVKLIDDSSLVEVISEAIETRNCIVHNRGRVGAKYIRNVPNPRFAIDEIRLLDLDDLLHITSTIGLIVKRFDTLLAEKFGLQLLPYTEKTDDSIPTENKDAP